MKYNPNRLTLRWGFSTPEGKETYEWKHGISYVFRTKAIFRSSWSAMLLSKANIRDPSSVQINHFQGIWECRALRLQMMDTQITSWINTGQVHLVHLVHLSSKFSSTVCFCLWTAPLSCPEELLSYLFSSSWRNTALRIKDKRFNLSRCGNKPWVSGKKPPRIFFIFFPKDVNHGPFSGMIFRTTNTMFFPILAHKL